MKQIITIYQPKKPTFRVDKRNLENFYFTDDYKIVYSEEVTDKDIINETYEVLLEKLFFRFNAGNYPANYTGHSLSVGDIVQVELNDGQPDDIATTYDKQTFICCDCGWSKINFMSTREYIEQADSKLYQQMRG